MAEIELFKLESGDNHIETLDAFIARLSDIRNRIPLHKRAAAIVDIWCTGDYAYTYADVNY